jgi:hypothetical protein
MLLTQNYKVLYGDDIYTYFKPKQDLEISKSTNNNMCPVSYQEGYSSFCGFSGGISSDNYSFLDQSDDELGVKGNGGIRQMRNYVSLEDSNKLQINYVEDNTSGKSTKLTDMDTNIEKLQRSREQELSNLKHNQS